MKFLKDLIAFPFRVLFSPAVAITFLIGVVGMIAYGLVYGSHSIPFDDWIVLTIGFFYGIVFNVAQAERASRAECE